MVIIFDSFPVNALPDDDTLDALGQVAMTVFEHTGRAYPPHRARSRKRFQSGCANQRPIAG